MGANPSLSPGPDVAPPRLMRFRLRRAHTSGHAADRTGMHDAIARFLAMCGLLALIALLGALVRPPAAARPGLLAPKPPPPPVIAPVGAAITADPDDGVVRGTVIMVHAGGWAGHDAAARDRMLRDRGDVFRQRGWPRRVDRLRRGTGGRAGRAEHRRRRARTAAAPMAPASTASPRERTSRSSRRPACAPSTASGPRHANRSLPLPDRGLGQRRRPRSSSRPARSHGCFRRSRSRWRHGSPCASPGRSMRTCC